MKARLFTEYGALNSQPVWQAFRHGMYQYGIQESNDWDFAVIWSVLWNGRMKANKQVWEEAQRYNKPVVVLEVGGIKRGVTWKVGIGGINREAYFGEPGNGPERAERLGLKLKPWQTGRDIIICSQNPFSHQWRNMPSMSTWVLETVSTIRKHTAQPIIIRSHPRAKLEAIEHEFINVKRQDPRHIVGTYDDFDFDFHNAHAVINWSSNPATQAVIGGVPVFTGPESLAWPVANQTLETIKDPIKPDRTQWLNDIAHTEWTLDEISKGLAIKNIITKLNHLVLAKTSN